MIRPHDLLLQHQRTPVEQSSLRVLALGLIDGGQVHATGRQAPDIRQRERCLELPRRLRIVTLRERLRPAGGETLPAPILRRHRRQATDQPADRHDPPPRRVPSRAPRHRLPSSPRVTAPRCPALPRGGTNSMPSLWRSPRRAPRGPRSPRPRQDAGVEVIRLSRDGAPQRMGEDHPDNIGWIEEVDGHERRVRTHALPLSSTAGPHAMDSTPSYSTLGGWPTVRNCPKRGVLRIPVWCMTPTMRRASG